MALLKKSDLIAEYNNRQRTVFAEATEKRHAEDLLRKAAADFRSTDSFDIFLSHSYSDARAIQALRDLLAENGYRVYVDCGAHRTSVIAARLPL